VFKCDGCQRSDHRPNRVVVERRSVVYPDRPDRPGGHGSQIAREMNLCSACSPSVATERAVFDVPLAIGDMPSHHPAGKYLSVAELEAFASAK
jgi:hypothetical protein